jgi:prephenate dehydratase
MNKPEQTSAVSLLGAPGAYHDIACDYLLPETPEEQRLRCGSFPEIFQKLSDGEADHAIIAVANSEIGALWDAYDLIAQHDAFAVGEARLRIRHNLLVLPDVETIEQIATVRSNPKALKQCQEWLTSQLPNAVQQSGTDTATCAQEVAEQKDPRVGAIASRQAAEIYGLKIIEASIETNPRNETRFLMFERAERCVEGADKTSIIMATSNRTNALYEALGPWALNGIGLSMIESRLMPHQVRSPWGAQLYAQGQHEELDRLRSEDPSDPWDAHFYMDLEAGLHDERMQRAMAELHEQEGVVVRVLGSYCVGKLIE